ncbi:YqeG family HAD IIIA-type phosphatase [Gorillibacterium timonense]|uniref:YqeG family HAD IIIA-type phosphatase n=1 Tax=Gorillibacterium timonense TaxID=1689269 RepID=UPI00071E1C83|nr:YqeG family HAD IIIA-type phosphatase [Gorillibacterium timonense]
MLNKLIPRQQIATIYELVLTELWEQGIRGIITDLDNTLVSARTPLATPELIKWLSELQDLGFKVVVLSNNGEARVSKFATPLGIPFVYGARKPRSAAFHRALSLLDLEPEQVLVLGDQMLTDVLGGNRLGLYTVLVQPIALQEEGFFTRVNRQIEKLVRLLNKNT